MFNKKLKQRIKDLEERCDYFQSLAVHLEKDYFTKNVHYKEDMVVIQGEKESENCFYGITLKEWQKTKFYFLKGTEPKCDFIREHLDGKIEFLKNQVVCNKEGKIISKIVR